MQENNQIIIEINGIDPPLHLESEPGRYIQFLSNIKHIILSDLNTGAILKVTMSSEFEAEKLLEALSGLKINDNTDFSMKVYDNLLKVYKYITIKTGN